MVFSSVSFVYAFGEKAAKRTEGIIRIENLYTGITRPEPYFTLIQNGYVYLSGTDLAEIGDYGFTYSSVREIIDKTGDIKLYGIVSLEPIERLANYVVSLLPQKWQKNIDKKTASFVKGETAMLYNLDDKCFYHLEGEFEVESIEYENNIYFRLDKMLYLMNAQWYFDEGKLTVYPIGNTIIDFLNKNIDYIVGHSVKGNALLMNGDSAMKHTAQMVLAKIIDDGDMRIFLGSFGEDMIMTDIYKDSILLLADDDLVWLEKGQAEINKILEGSNFEQIKTDWGMLTGLFGTPGDINELRELASKNPAKFSIWNDSARLDASSMQSLSEVMEKIGYGLEGISMWNQYNEIIDRSSKWGEDFLKYLEILNLDPNTEQTFDHGKWIKSAANKLLDEKKDSFKAAKKYVAVETIMLVTKEVTKKLTKLTTAGKILSIISLGVKIFTTSPDIKAKIEGAKSMLTVQGLINVEQIAVRKMADNFAASGKVTKINDMTAPSGFNPFSYLNSYLSGKTYERQARKLDNLRVSTRMVLQTTLVNKRFVYQFKSMPELNNDAANWIKSPEEAKLRNEIYKTYALMVELNNTEDFDKALIISEDFKGLVSDEYGNMRSTIPISAIEINDKDELYNLYKQVNEVFSSITSLEADFKINQSINIADENTSTYNNGRIKQVIHSETDNDFYMTLDSNILGRTVKGEAYYRGGYIFYNLSNGDKFKVALSLDEVLRQAAVNNVQFGKSLVKKAYIETGNGERTIKFILDGDRFIERASSSGLGLDALFTKEIVFDLSSDGDIYYTLIIDDDDMIKSYTLQYLLDVTVDGEKGTIFCDMKFTTISVNDVTIVFPSGIEGYEERRVNLY